MNRYRITIFIIFIMFILLAYQAKGYYINETPLFGKIIFLDAGHGGKDPGALYKDIYEKDINLEIVKLLRDNLESKGAVVYLTREGDYDLATPHSYIRKRSDLFKRAQMINNSDCYLYLSIHLNASVSTTWRGAQVFYDEINSENKMIAKLYQNSFKKYLGSRRAIKEVNDLYMYHRINRPGVLLEVGYISNPNERYILQKKYYQKRIILAITNATMEYFK